MICGSEAHRTALRYSRCESCVFGCLCVDLRLRSICIIARGSIVVCFVCVLFVLNRVVYVVLCDMCVVCSLYVLVSECICCEGDVAQMVERSLSMREVLGSIPSFSNHEVLLWYDRRQPHNPKLCTSWVRLWQTSTMSNFLFYIHIAIQHTTYTVCRNITIFKIVKINGTSQVITQFCTLFILLQNKNLALRMTLYNINSKTTSNNPNE